MSPSIFGKIQRTQKKQQQKQQQQQQKQQQQQVNDWKIHGMIHCNL